MAQHLPQQRTNRARNVSPVPEDPRLSEDSVTEEQKKALWQEQFEDMCQILEQTINSRPSFKLLQLARYFSEDYYGFDPEVVARNFGFSSFVGMLHDDLMDEIVCLQPDPYDPKDPVLYTAKDNPLFEHLRREMLVGESYQLSKKQKQEAEKFTRANTFANRAQVLEGRKLVARLVYELGGETVDVHWQEVQNRYLEQKQVPLTKEEMRKYFQRSSPIRILQSYCYDEIELRHDQNNGTLHLRLKRPYTDIMAQLNSIDADQQRFQLPPELRGREGAFNLNGQGQGQGQPRGRRLGVDQRAFNPNRPPPPAPRYDGAETTYGGGETELDEGDGDGSEAPAAKFRVPPSQQDGQGGSAARGNTMLGRVHQQHQGTFRPYGAVQEIDEREDGPSRASQSRQVRPNHSYSSDEEEEEEKSDGSDATGLASLVERTSKPSSSAGPSTSVYVAAPRGLIGKVQPTKTTLQALKSMAEKQKEQRAAEQSAGMAPKVIVAKPRELTKAQPSSSSSNPILPPSVQEAASTRPATAQSRSEALAHPLVVGEEDLLCYVAPRPISRDDLPSVYALINRLMEAAYRARAPKALLLSELLSMLAIKNVRFYDLLHATGDPLQLIVKNCPHIRALGLNLIWFDD